MVSRKKYRASVMISSTTKDLAKHRKEAINAVLRASMYPLIMETLGATGGDAISDSIKLVNEADVYIGIFGRRYGYIPHDSDRNPDKISITHMEYERAIERGIPVRIFVMSDSHAAPTVGDLDMFIEQSEIGKEKHKALIEHISTEHVVYFFRDETDLRAAIIQALATLRDELQDKELPSKHDNSFSSRETNKTIKQQKRRLEVAIPACTKQNTKSQLKVKISLLDSAGLRDELPEVLPSGDVIQQGDIRSTNFPLRFPIDRQTGKLKLVRVCITITSDYFSIQPITQTTDDICASDQFNLSVPSDDDSRTLNFSLEPKTSIFPEVATVNVIVYQDDNVICENMIQTQIVKSLDDSPLCGDWRLHMKSVLSSGHDVNIPISPPQSVNANTIHGNVQGNIFNVGGARNLYAPVSFGAYPIQYAPQPESKKIFLSYARKDDHADYNDPTKSFMRRLYDALKDDYDVWWDRESMPSRGKTFTQEIRDAVADSSRLILIVGEGIHASEYVKAEWQFALSRCIPVIPILRKGNRQTVPDVLRQVHTPKFLDDDAFDEQIAELKRILTDNDAPLGTLYGVPPLPDNYIQREILDEVQAKLLVDTTKPLVVTSAKQQTVSVHGVGGIGKTTLSCALARSCDVRRHFPDGVFFIEVGKKPDLLARMAAIGAIFGDDRQQYIDMNAAAQRLSAILADKHALLVLDDVWEHGHAKVFQVAHTRCRLLVTTRIRGLLTTLNMQSAGLSNLTESEGLDLIAKRVSDEERTVTVAELPEECKALISLVEGHTLAVSLIAARLTKHEGGLDYAPRLLSRLEKGKYFRTLQLNETDKNHNLELCLRLSYDDLGEDLQRRFRALGVLASDGTFDEALAMALWGDEDDDDTDDALTRFVRKGLLRREDKNRYGQHGLLRAYALALLTEADERDDTFLRYAEYVTEVAKKFYELPPEKWSQLDDDIPFIQHVGDQLAEAYEAREDWQDLALQFAINTRNYVNRRPEIHRIQWLEMGLAVSKLQTNQSHEALFAVDLGSYHNNRGDKQQALAYYEQGLSSYRELVNKSAEAVTLNNIGEVHSALGDKELALSYYKQALPIRREVGDRGGEASTLNNIGAVYRSLGDKESALRYYEQALPIVREVSDRSGEATTLNNIGMVYDKLGDKQEALRYYEQALPIRREVGDRRGEAVTLNNIAAIYFHNSQWEQAINIFEQIIEIVHQMGAVAEEASFRLNKAVVHQKMGYIDEAIAQVKRGRDILIQNNLPYNAGGASVADYDRLLSQLRSEDTVSEQERFVQAMVQAYQEGGETGLREMLSQAGANDEQIESLVAQIKSVFGDDS